MMTEKPSPSDPVYTLENYTPLRNVGRYIAEVAGIMTGTLDRQTAPLGITGAQWIVLMRIASGSGSTAAELCRTMDYDSGSMTRMLDRMEKAGLIERTRCPDDRRVVNLSLSDKARELYPKLPPIAIATLNAALKGFSPEEEQLLLGLLVRIRTNLNEDE